MGEAYRCALPIQCFAYREWVTLIPSRQEAAARGASAKPGDEGGGG